MVLWSDPREKTACFTGHRSFSDPPGEIAYRTEQAIRALIGQGYLYFCAGGARGFDALASETVLRIQAEYPDVHLVLVLPFPEQYRRERNWSEEEVAQYRSLLRRASRVVTLEEQYAAGVYHLRNRRLVDLSSACVAYLKDRTSGTGYTVRYARQQMLRVVNVAQWDARSPLP